MSTQSFRREDTSSLLDTVCVSIHEFLLQEILGGSWSLLDTLKWFVFRCYKRQRIDADKTFDLITLSPYKEFQGVVILEENEISSDGILTCKQTGKKLYLTDIFRFHEIIGEEIGATGIYGYLANIIQHLIAIHNLLWTALQAYFVK